VLRAQNPHQCQCIHQRTAVEANNQQVGFRVSFVSCTVRLMLRAFLLISACMLVSEPAPTVSADRASESGGAIRNCLRVASGLREQGDREGASAHVLTCYEQHFVPIESTLREHNRRATLSLEFGFGLLARSMSQRRGEPMVAAGMLSDRVESVLASIPKEAKLDEKQKKTSP
jgi:hypothetical protein